MSLEDARKLAEGYTAKNRLSGKVQIWISVWLQTVIEMNKGGNCRHGGAMNYQTISNVQSDLEANLLEAGVTQEDLNRLSGTLLGVKED